METVASMTAHVPQSGSSTLANSFDDAQRVCSSLALSQGKTVALSSETYIYLPLPVPVHSGGLGKQMLLFLNLQR